MKLSDIMARRPLTADRATPRAELTELMETAGVHHLPLLDGESLVGLWVARDTGPMEFLRPEHVYQAPADSAAVDAISELMGGREAVIAREEGKVVGLLTRTDALDVIERALERGIGKRRTRPVIVRLCGEKQGGKSTLLLKTIPLLSASKVAVVHARRSAPGSLEPEEIEGATVLVEPRAHLGGPLSRAIRELGEVDVVFVEDDGEPPSTMSHLPGDYIVLVWPAEGVDELDSDALAEVDALVVTKLDVAPRSFDLDAERERLAGDRADLDVFGVAAGSDERGLDPWRRWLRRRVLPRRH
ncbi:MAG: CBS domain-containing protein [Miltoncostaeaceae bacterium]